MAAGATFLGGAKSRLLPASVPFRFFGAAAGFQVAAWVCVMVGGAELPGFAGGLGWPLAALHAVTLGVLTMSAVGASLQLLPVATRQPVAVAAAPALLWWLLVPGIVVLLVGMAFAWPAVLAFGGAAVAIALVVYGALLAVNLARGRGMAVVAAHGWAAVIGLVLLLASGLSLVLGWLGEPGLARSAALGLHIAFAAYGFMGLLVLGFSHILVPMFAVGDMAATRPASLSLALALCALAFGTAGSFDIATDQARVAACVFGLAALGLHVGLMLRVIRGGLRPDLGPSFVLVRCGWAGLGASLLAAALVWPDGPAAEWSGARAFFVALLVLALLSFLLGMLARIVPFLASMHAPAGRRGPPTPTTLTDARAQAVGVACHLAASGLLLLAVIADSAWLARLAGAIGCVGALAWCRYVAFAWQRTRAPVQRAPNLNQVN